MSTSWPKQKLRVSQKKINISSLLSEMAWLATLWCQEEGRQHFQGWVKRQKTSFTAYSKPLGSPKVNQWWIPLYTEQDPAWEGDMSALPRTWYLLFFIIIYCRISFLSHFPYALVTHRPPTGVQKSHLQARHKGPSDFEKNFWEWGSPP